MNSLEALIRTTHALCFKKTKQKKSHSFQNFNYIPLGITFTFPFISNPYVREKSYHNIIIASRNEFLTNLLCSQLIINTTTTVLKQHIIVKIY